VASLVGFLTADSESARFATHFATVSVALYSACIYSSAFLEMEVAFLPNDLSYCKMTEHLVARCKRGCASHHSFSASWQRRQRCKRSVSSTTLRRIHTPKCQTTYVQSATSKKEQVRFRQIFVTISKVSPNIREKSCQKCVTISVPSRSILLSYCQICVTITIDVFYRSCVRHWLTRVHRTGPCPRWE
jgi:hypothetical protein